MEENKEKLLKPKYDVVFQALFQENRENITQDFISTILGEKVEIIESRTDESLIRKYPTDKAGRLDLKTKFTDGTICQIEMQLVDYKNTIKRILYYWSRTYSEQLKRGYEYEELKKTIGIVITDYEIKELEGIEELGTKWKIIDTQKGKKVLTDELELIIIEIPKALRILGKNRDNKIAQWMMFLDNPNTEEVKSIMKENKEVKKAASILHVMSENEELQRLAELKEKWERDEKSSRSAWKKEGIEEGAKSKTIEIAKKMRKIGIKIEEIEEATGLTKAEIEKL